MCYAKFGESASWLRIAMLSVLLICLNLSAVPAASSDKAEPLDPVAILLCQPQPTVEPQTDQAATKELPDGALTAGESRPVSTQLLSSDADPLPFSTAYFRTTFEPGQGSHKKEMPEPQQTTATFDLLKTNISSVAESPNNPDRNILRRLVEQIGSVKFPHKRPQSPTPGPSQPTESQQAQNNASETAGPNDLVSTEASSAQQNEQQSASALSAETVKRIEQIISDSGDAQDPQILAELLQQAGLYQQAAYFYELAVSHDDQKQLTDADKAWLLTQRALCLARKDPQQAEQIYAKVASEYSATPWTELAQTRRDLTDWLNTEQPEKLIDNCRTDLKQTDN
jgi:hypothetical protein